MSLKDPISTMRMTMPCRSTVCSHNQCFDGSYFLQLQEQAPTWTCPVCNKTLSYRGLCIDQYVQDILRNTSASTEPDGKWHAVVQGEDNSGKNGKGLVRAPYDNDSDDDIIEIQDSRFERVKNEAASTTPGIAQQTPPLSSREASTAAPIAAARSGSKRTSAVIDLTLSDDDEPPRPTKRTHTSQITSYSTPQSLSGGRVADTGPRQPSSLGQSFPPFRPNTLPPLQLGPTNGGIPNGQQSATRLPWLPGPSHTNTWHGSGTFRDSHENYSHSPG